MPVLICDLGAEPASLASEYQLLRASAESLALYWPHPGSAPLPPGFVLSGSAVEMRCAWENGHIAVLGSIAHVPIDEFDRCLVIGHGLADPSSPEQACARVLLAAGAEEVELLAPADARDLAQSWRSGRRTGSQILRAR